MTTTALITGASSGIGHELTHVFALHQHNLVLVARNEAKMLELKATLESTYGVKVTVIAKDLSLRTSPDELFSDLSHQDIRIDILVNNAGFGAYGEFHTVDLNSELEMVDVNVRALTHLSRLAIPGMVKRGQGWILNVASTAAFQPGPLMSVYFATKAYVLSLSEALRNELKPYGVRVTALCPGPTETGFVERANMHKSKLFQGRVMHARTVAQAGYRGLMNNHPLVIPGVRNRVLATGVKFVPRRIVPAIARRVQREI